MTCHMNVCSRREMILKQKEVLCLPLVQPGIYIHRSISWWNMGMLWIIRIDTMYVFAVTQHMNCELNIFHIFLMPRLALSNAFRIFNRTTTKMLPQKSYLRCPGPQRAHDAMIASLDVKTTPRRRFDVIMTLFLRRMSGGGGKCGLETWIYLGPLLLTWFNCNRSMDK